MQNKVWDDCLTILKSDLTESQFNTWIKPLSVIEDEEAQSLTLLAPNKFVVNWVQKNYLEKIKSVASKRLDGKATVAISIGDEPYSNSIPPNKKDRVITPVGSPLNNRYVFDNFVGGKSNQLARAAALQITENPGISYNPFFIYGGVGLGKTHLMQSVCNAIKEKQPDKKVAYVHSERFV